MNATDMKFALLLKFDSLFNFQSPGYDDRQISELLTDAQFRVFIKKYNPFGDKYKEGFEGSEKRRRDLEQLIRQVTLLPADESANQTGVHPDGTFYDMPSDFLYAVEEGATQSGATTESWVKPVKHDEYQANKNNPYKKPYKDLVWRMDYASDANTGGTDVSKRAELITHDGTAVDKYRVRYLATPPAIVVDEFDTSNNINCILDETLHREIVDEAVVIAQAAVQPQKYQVGVSEQNRAE